MIWLGLAIMIVSETLTLLHVEPFWSWNTPIAWTGFIIFADAIVWRARGESWIRSAPGELAFLDQTYFLMGLIDGRSAPALAASAGALKTLIAPGGLGSTLKVLIFGKGVGTPALKGCSFKVRAT